MAEARIEILEEHNSGLYGKVFKARQVDLDRVIAVKIIKPEWSHAADAIAHAKALAKVDGHPNIVTVYGVEKVSIKGVGEDLPALLMEWLEGETLGERLGGEKFSLQEARRVCSGVFDGVEHMHDKDRAHGDLHPGNVMLLADCSPKIIDIDANKNNSLARLSTISRDGAINNDIAFCRRIGIFALQHARFPNTQINSIDSELQSADTLNDVRQVVDAAFDTERTPTHLASRPTAFRVETPDYLVEQVQNYIEQEKSVSLRSLMMGQVRLICEELTSDRFVVQGPVDPEAVRRRVESFEETVGPILPALAVGGFWGDDNHAQVWKDCIEAVANVYEDKQSWAGNKALIQLRLYPPLLMLYSAGMGAFMNGRFATLRVLLRECEYVHMRRRSRLSTELYHWKAESRDLWNDRVIGDKQNHYTPISDRLCQVTGDAVAPLTVLKTDFDRRFDRFEYFIGLVESYGDGNGSPEFAWGPIGSFIWRSSRRGSEPVDLGQELLADAGVQSAIKRDWPPFSAGFFRGRKDDLTQAVRSYTEFLNRVRGQLHIF